jgi:hypothetical protein
LAGQISSVQAALHNYEQALAEYDLRFVLQAVALNALLEHHITSVSELKSAIKKYIKVLSDKLAKPFR